MPLCGVANIEPKDLSRQDFDLITFKVAGKSVLLFDKKGDMGKDMVRADLELQDEYENLLKEKEYLLRKRKEFETKKADLLNETLALKYLLMAEQLDHEKMKTIQKGEIDEEEAKQYVEEHHRTSIDEEEQ